MKNIRNKERKMINIENMMGVTKELVHLAENINNSKLTLEEVETELEKTLFNIKYFTNIMIKIINNEEIEGFDEELKTLIKSKIQEDLLNYNYEEHKKDILTILEMAENVDKRIGNDLLLPYLAKILDTLLPFLDEVHEDLGMVVRKSIKEFNEKKKRGKICL